MRFGEFRVGLYIYFCRSAVRFGDFRLSFVFFFKDKLSSSFVFAAFVRRKFFTSFMLLADEVRGGFDLIVFYFVEG